MSVLLLVFNPRQIPECIDAIGGLGCRKVWLTNYTEHELEQVVPRVIDSTDADHYLAISDDTLPTQQALDRVTDLLEGGHPVATGYCNLDAHLPYVNLCDEPLAGEPPSRDSYRFLTQLQVGRHQGEVVPTTFAGFCLTGMDRAMWQRFPFRTYGDPGFGSDYNLSMRLQAEGIPIVSHKHAGFEHLKAVWSEVDMHPDRQLNVGKEPPRITHA